MADNSPFVSKTLSLRQPENPDQAPAQTQEVLKEPIIKSECLDQAIRAKDLLKQAEQTRQTMLDDTENQIQAAREEASKQVLDSAEALLSHWREEQQKQLADFLPQASELVFEALKKLMVDLPPEALMESLLKQLIEAKSKEAKAKLYCHPDMTDVLAEQAENHGTAVWQITPDAALEQSELRLEDENGVYQAGLALSVAALAG